MSKYWCVLLEFLEIVAYAFAILLFFAGDIERAAFWMGMAVYMAVTKAKP